MVAGGKAGCLDPHSQTLTNGQLSTVAVRRPIVDEDGYEYFAQRVRDGVPVFDPSLPCETVAGTAVFIGAVRRKAAE